MPDLHDRLRRRLLEQGTEPDVQLFRDIETALDNHRLALMDAAKARELLAGDMARLSAERDAARAGACAARVGILGRFAATVGRAAGDG